MLVANISNVIHVKITLSQRHTIYILLNVYTAETSDLMNCFIGISTLTVCVKVYFCTIVVKSMVGV